MIADAFAHCEDVRTVLDAPCGVGRATIWLAENEYAVTGIDLGEGALNLAARLLAGKGLSARLEKRDLFATGLPERSYDAVLCFRLIHHFDSRSLQQQLVKELCRLSDGYVVISRITPWSWTSMRRRVRRLISGTPIKQYPVARRDLNVWFASHGFREVARLGRFPLLHSLQVQVYERE